MPDTYSDLNANQELSEQQQGRRAIENLELMPEHVLSQPASLPADGFSYHTCQVASSSSTSDGHQESLTLDDNQPGRTTEKRGYTRISGSSALTDPAVATTKKQRTASAQTHRSFTLIAELIDSAERDFKRFNTQKAKDTLETVSTLLLTDVGHATSAALMARFRYYILFSEIYHDLGQIDIAQQHVTEARSLLMQPAFVRSDHQERLSETALFIQQSALNMTESTSVVIQQDVLDVTKKPPVIALLESVLVKLDTLDMSARDSIRANVLLHLGCACFSIGFIADGRRYWEQLCAIPRFDANEYKRLSSIISACQLILQLQQGKQYPVNYLKETKIWVTQYLPNFYPTVFLGQISLSLANAMLHQTNVYKDAKNEALHALSIFADACFPESHPFARHSKIIYLTILWLKAIAQVKDGQFILSEQTLDSVTCRALAAALIHPHCHIDKLWIKDCHINNKDLINLVNVFKDKRCKIKQFILENHDVKKRGGIKIFTLEERDEEKNDKVALLDALIRSNLIELYLHGCKLNDNDSEKIEQTLIEHEGRLVTLSLNDNKITSSAVIFLAKSLAKMNCKLINLGLCNNNIDDDGVFALANELTQENSKLTHLGLAGNYIGSKGIKALIEALKSPNCQLIAVNLQNMDLDDECLQALFRAMLDPNCKIVHLKIGGNKLNEASLMALTDTLKDHRFKLASLKLTCPAEFEQAIVAAIQVNDSLTEVSGLNNFSESALEQIKECCDRNRRNLTQKNTSLAQHLGHWATFFDSPTNIDASVAPEPPLSNDEVTTAKTHADNVAGTSACSLNS